jgi:hypothetical protein
MLAMVMLAAGVLAVISAVALVGARLLLARRARGLSGELGVVSQRWLNGHRSETL